MALSTPPIIMSSFNVSFESKLTKIPSSVPATRMLFSVT